VILLDVCMPIMDGAQFRRTAPQSRPARDPDLVPDRRGEEPMLDLASTRPAQADRQAAVLAIVARHAPRRH